MVSPVLGRPVSGIALFVALAAGVLAPTSIPAQEARAAMDELRLGVVDFPNSGAESAQSAFERGLLLLHSFEYGPAAEAFREAQAADPGFVMAYWGEAMTYNHPVWMEQDRDAALEALAGLAPTPTERARTAGAEGGRSEREAAYVRAVDVLYGEGSREERDVAYADAMARLHATYPDDEDAAAFHALALLGTAHEGRDFATYMRAAGILEQVVDAHPRHPGIAHYLIHSYDDPIHAPLGLRAARAYSEIAPDAPHAQHMTSHIFVALGMWEDVIEANENSIRVLDAQLAAAGEPSSACGHYHFWLEYGYLQEGRTDEALRLLRECHELIRLDAREGGTRHWTSGYYSRMLARFVVDADRVAAAGPLGWEVDYTDVPQARATVAFSRGYDAAMRGDARTLEAARLELAAAREAIAAQEAGSDAPAASDDRPTREGILELELEALALSLAGDAEGAVTVARGAVAAEEALPLEFGPPNIDKPTHELLGELLLAAGRPDEARLAFEAALARTPERVTAGAGLAAAERRLEAGR